MATLPNPVDGWGCAVRAVVLLAAAGAGLVAGRAQSADARSMKRLGHTGIVGFEMIRSWQRADPVLAAWGAEGRRAARSSLWWDTLLFIPAYTALLGTLAGVAAGHAAARGWPGWADAATLALYAVGVAAACDLVENCALFGVLRQRRSLDYPKLTTSFAAVKWALLLLVGVVVATVGLLFVAAPGTG